MKIIAVLFALLFYSSVSRANTNAYGAWWETGGPFVRKDSGGLSILFEGDVTSHLGTGGVVTVSMIYNESGDRYEISGHYQRRVGDFVSFKASPTNLTFLSPPAWTGRLKLRNGECEGRWYIPGLHGPAPGGGRYILKAIHGRFVSHVRLPYPPSQDP
jgi:hypothetical protein